jgi:hypothetical protein
LKLDAFAVSKLPTYYRSQKIPNKRIMDRQPPAKQELFRNPPEHKSFVILRPVSHFLPHESFPEPLEFARVAEQ